MDWISNPDIWIALLTLTSLEIILGVDNVIFISILSDKLPVDQRKRARTLGLGLAMFMRIGLLLSISWVIGLKEPIFHIGDHGFSGRDLILLGGGAFLIAKATLEIHAKLEGEEEHASSGGKVTSFAGTIVQILILDIVFSLDSVITAVGMAEEVGVMIAAVVIAVGVMMLSAGPISDFVQHHPTVKMLALSFLVMIGFSLVAEGWGLHISKGYIYAAMGFSVLVEVLNLQVSKRRKKTIDPVQLRPDLEAPR